MAELRYNPLLGDYVMIASHRQSRPQMPQNYCPFCPGSGREAPADSCSEGIEEIAENQPSAPVSWPAFGQQ